MTPFPFSERSTTNPSFDAVELDTIDEAISAVLDGEFDALAAEYGADPARSLARLRAWPGYEDRMRAFQGSQAAVAQAPAPLDDFDRARLLSVAQRAADPSVPAVATRRRDRRVRVTAVLGAAAAAIVIVVVGLTVLDRPSDTLAQVSTEIDDSGAGSDSASDSAEALTTTAPAAPATQESDVGALDATSRREELVATANRDLARSGEGSTSNTDGGAPAANSCVASSLASLDSSVTAFEVATGTYAGQTVLWIVARTADGPVGLVVDPGSCAILAETP